MTELKRLREIAEKATPGPWHIGHINIFDHADINCEDGTIAQVVPRSDRAYIVTFSPDRILRILDALDVCRDLIDHGWWRSRMMEALEKI